MAAALDVSASQPGGKKKKRSKSGGGSLTPEQEAQRQRQRECREAALAARAGGKEYVSAKTVKQRQRPTLARRKFDKRQEATPSKGERNAARREQQKQSKQLRQAESARAPTVVIIPIFWKGEAQQMALVLSVCADVQAALEEGGVRCELDGGHKYTPGQKFAHWEHKGVKLRVEVGPREAQRGKCTIAKTFKPGVPARRVTGVEVGDGLAGRLEDLAALSVEGDGEEEEEGFEMEREAGAATPAAAGQQQEEEGGEGAARRGGDDLGDNMEAPAADEEAPAEGKAKKKRKKGADDAPTPTAREQARLAAAEPAAEDKPKKKKKTVIF